MVSTAIDPVHLVLFGFLVAIGVVALIRAGRSAL